MKRLIALAAIFLAGISHAADVRLTWDQKEPTKVSKFTIKESRNGKPGSRTVAAGATNGGSASLPDGSRRYVHTVGTYNPGDSIEFRVVAQASTGATSSESNALTAVIPLPDPRPIGYVSSASLAVGENARRTTKAGSIETSVIQSFSATSGRCENQRLCPFVAGAIVRLAQSGPVYLWARTFADGASGAQNVPNSFWVCVDQTTCKKLSNNATQNGTWYWGGDGSPTSGPLENIVPVSLGTLPAGDHRLELFVREAYPQGPFLDVLYLSASTTPKPTDDGASNAINPTTTTTTTTSTTTTTTTVPRLTCANRLDVNHDGFIDATDVQILESVLQGASQPQCRE